MRPQGRHALILVLLSLAACSHVRTATHQVPMVPAQGDSLQAPVDPQADRHGALKAVRWRLLRAGEARACSLYEQAQMDLDQAFHILAGIESAGTGSEATADRLSALRAAVEGAYLSLLPHLDRFSPDSPLVLLLEGLSEEKIEELPPDAAPLVRIHQLRPQCDVPIDANAKVAASTHFFQTRGRQTCATWLRRAGRYRPMILDILRTEGVPQDLLYVCMIESGFNPRAYSRARAAGLWQFMAGTGRGEGLRINHYVDERRDPLKSTRAAARHLKRLHREFGDWRLAVAAYNAGRGRVSRAIAKAGSRSFWDLDLPRETSNYVPLFMAATIIGKNPALFGFEDVEADAPLTYTTVKLPQPIRLEAAAKCLGTTLPALKGLNPELRRDITPPNAGRPYRLHVPPGRDRDFLTCYNRLPRAEKLAWYVHEVRPRDSVWSISEDYGVRPGLIIDANNLANPDRIFQGQKLHIPAAADMLAGRGRAPSTAMAYTVRRGDTLGRIARKHGTSVPEVRRLNNLKGDIIHPGERLTIRKVTARTAAPAPPKPNAEGQLFHTVQSGDSLWDIGRRFGADVESLRQWNQLNGSVIYPGQKLIVRSPEPADGHLYTVVAGDTLYSIARRFGLEVEALARQNRMSLSTSLLTGATLEIRPPEGR